MARARPLPSAVFKRLVPELPAQYVRKLDAAGYQAACCMLLELDQKLTDIYWLNIADEAVPFEENSKLVEARYRQLGGKIELIVKPGGNHHPHSLKDPTPIVNFVLKHAPAP